MAVFTDSVTEVATALGNPSATAILNVGTAPTLSAIDTPSALDLDLVSVAESITTIESIIGLVGARTVGVTPTDPQSQQAIKRRGLNLVNSTYTRRHSTSKWVYSK